MYDRPYRLTSLGVHRGVRNLKALNRMANRSVQRTLEIFELSKSLKQTKFKILHSDR